MRKLVFAVSMALTLPALTSLTAQSTDRMTVDEWRSYSEDARRELFSSFSSAKKTSILGGHVQAWREQHKSELSAAQDQFIDELKAVIVPEMWTAVKTTKQLFEAAVMDKARALFRDDEIAELLYLHFDPVPLKKSPSGISVGDRVEIGHDSDAASRASRAARGACGAPGPSVVVAA